MCDSPTLPTGRNLLKCLVVEFRVSSSGEKGVMLLRRSFEYCFAISGALPRNFRGFCFFLSAGFVPTD